MLLGDCRADLAWRCANDARRFTGECVRAVRAGSPSRWRSSRPPGIDQLYSGVTNRTASTAAIAFLNSVATAGKFAS